MTDSSLNIYQRMNAAKKMVATANFKKVSTQGLKYSYLPIEAIKPIVEDALNESGIVMVFEHFRWIHVREPWDAVSRQPYGDVTSRWYHLEGSMDIVFVNMDDPRDRIVCNFSGEGKDNSDKAISKLYTAILKNAYKQIFNVAEKGDDTDNTSEEVAHEKAQIEAAKKQKKDPFFDGPSKTEKKEKVYKDTPVPPKSEKRIKAEAVSAAARTGPGREALLAPSEKHGLSPAMLKNADAMEQQPDDVLEDCFNAIKEVA